MKVFWVTIGLFAAVIAVVMIHISIVNSFRAESVEILRKLESAVEREDFTAANTEIDNFERLYQSRRRWFSVIFDTADLDAIETHIAKIRRFLELGAIVEFHGEFIALYLTIDTLPYREGVHLEVLF